MESELAGILVAVFGSGGVGVAVVNYFATRRQQKFVRERDEKIRQVQASFSRIAEIYKSLHALRLSTRSNRVCVLKTENGGGVPAPGCDVKSSVLYESADPSMAKELSTSWQRVPLNGTWASVLQHIAADKCADLTPAMAVSPHYDFLTESDCARVHFVLIALSESAMFYLSVHLAAGIDLSQKEQSNMYQHARRITELFAKEAQEE